VTSDAEVNVVDEELNWSPLIWAVAMGDRRLVRLMLDKGARLGPVRRGGETPINLAASRGRLDIVKDLVEGGAKVSPVANWRLGPLHWGAISGNTDVVKYLLAQGAPVDLYAAAALGKPELVAKALDKNPSLIAAGYWYRKIQYEQPLVHVAIMAGQLEVVGLLIDRGVDINYTMDCIPENCLHIASSWGRTRIAKLLLLHGAQVDTATDNRYIRGWTPLHFAADNGHLDMVRLLVKHGAPTRVKCQGGETPLDLAVTRNHTSVVQFLRAAGSSRDTSRETSLRVGKSDTASVREGDEEQPLTTPAP